MGTCVQAVAAPAWYGAFELKQSYQKNMVLGTLGAVLAHLLIIGGLLVREQLKSRSVELADGSKEGRSVVIVVEPPPSIVYQRPSVQFGGPGATPKRVGIPTPAPDEQVPFEMVFPGQDALAPVVGSDSGTLPANGDANLYAGAPPEYLPPPGEFVPVEELPVLINRDQVELVYPEMARLTRKEATVTVRALVNREGRVKEAQIVKSSGSNVGFDEAAREHAFKLLYKPAIQNGHPVAIWVTYRVDFKLN